MSVTDPDRCSRRLPAQLGHVVLTGGLWGALISLLAHGTAVATAFLAWVSDPAGGHEATDSLSIGARVAALAAGGTIPFGAPLEAEGEILRWTLTGGPLLLTLLSAVMLARIVRRVVRRAGLASREACGVAAGAALAHWVTGALLLVGLAGQEALSGRWVALSLLASVLPAAWGLLRGVPPQLVDVWFGSWPGDLGEVLQDAARPARAAARRLLLAGALVPALLLVTRFPEVQRAHDALGLDVSGGVLLTLAQLGWAPNAATWGLAWLSGPGVELGGATFTPGGAGAGSLPAIPALAALPVAGGLHPLWWSVTLVPVAVGWMVPPQVRRELAEFVEEGGLVDIALRCVAVCLLLGLGAALLGVWAGVAMTPGEWAGSGVRDGWWAALAGWVGLGALVRLGADLARERLLSDPA
ncbi:hypothetical protein SAMN05445756_1433 [Kytococcus aerolatus]|uniref:Uncharacterized protein n=1 Tax=Kytococcus aerolatus TaxID=592308 RepID=A0A212TZL4_9MICO|nr:DUF6350 family protein [Kytococcus aerolatus]SNC71331.1 hypothetical protein SAMN05445756_1433 [Kytococcus aerolatus]